MIMRSQPDKGVGAVDLYRMNTLPRPRPSSPNSIALSFEDKGRRGELKTTGSEEIQPQARRSDTRPALFPQRHSLRLVWPGAFRRPKVAQTRSPGNS